MPELLLPVAAARPSAPVAALHAPAEATATRFVGLDVFRGLLVALMILVNTPGDVNAIHPVLDHAGWHGWWTLPAPIAPAFLWVVGIAIVLRAHAGGSPRRPRARAVVRRAALVFALGMLLNAVPRVVPLLDLSALHALRIPGTLQRIALCYLPVALVVPPLRLRGQLLLAAASLALWALALRVLTPPGTEVGTLEAARAAHVLVDHALLGAHAKVADPNGLLGTLPALTTTLLGTATGELMLRWRSARLRVGVLVMVGTALVGVGGTLARGLDVADSPWSAAYAVLMPGVAALALAACVWAVEVAGWRRGTGPLLVFGRSALWAFALSQLLAALAAGIGVPALGRDWLSLRGVLMAGALVPALGSARLASAVYAVLWVVGCWLLVAFLARHRWLPKI